MGTTCNYGIDAQLPNLIDKFKLSNIENFIIKMFQDAPKNPTIYYIGEYNKTDAMF